MKKITFIIIPILILGSQLYAAETDAAITAPGATPSPIKFKMHRVGTHRSEACGVADFNNDKKLDIVAGEFWYEAPSSRWV